MRESERERELCMFGHVAYDEWGRGVGQSSGGRGRQKEFQVNSELGTEADVGLYLNTEILI